MTKTRLRDISQRLQKNVADIRAIVLLGPDGVMDHVLHDPSLNIETIGIEFGTLLRIAGRTSEDSGAGRLIEHIVVSDEATVIGRTISREHFLILICRAQSEIGRARYELKQAAREIQRNG